MRKSMWIVGVNIALQAVRKLGRLYTPPVLASAAWAQIRDLGTTFAMVIPASYRQPKQVFVPVIYCLSLLCTGFIKEAKRFKEIGIVKDAVY
jgi:hypothetical protein